MAQFPSFSIPYSPSLVRQAASNSQDWAYVESWLTTLYKSTLSQSTPPFEHNPETLRALLALATANESADEEHALLFSTEAEALAQIQAYETSVASKPPALGDVLLDMLESSLSREGLAALDTMAALAVTTGTIPHNSVSLAQPFAALQAQIFETEQMMGRTQAFQEYLETSALPEATASLSEWSKAELSPSPNFSVENAESSRRFRVIVDRLPVLHKRIEEASRAAENVDNLDKIPSLDTIVREEAEYMRLMAIKKELDSTMAGFQHLPTDIEVAREELAQIRAKLKRENTKTRCNV